MVPGFVGERPHPLKPIELRYPPEAKKQRIQGKMLLKCIIGVDGAVSNCRVIKGLPYMTEAVISAVMHARFTPAIFQGKPVAVDIVIPIDVRAAEPDWHERDAG
jgi:protein TonB